MTDDFERRLRALFAETNAAQGNAAFEREVQLRIARLRRRRGAVLPAALALAAAALGVIVSPLIVAGTALLTEATAPLVGASAAWLWSPLAYAVGALCVVAALVDALTD